MADQATRSVTQAVGLSSYQIGLSINQAQRAFSELLRTCLGHHGLTIPEWSLLGVLYGSELALRPIEIAQKLGIKPPYIAKLISSLQPQGFIVCDSYPDDERGKSIVISQQGRRLVERVEPQLAICLQEQLGELKAEDLRVYFDLSQFIGQHVRHHAG